MALQLDEATPNTSIDGLTRDTTRPGDVAEVVVLSIFEVLVIIISTFIILLIWTHKVLRRNYTNWLVSNACLVLLVGAIFHRWAYIVMAYQDGIWILWDGSCHVMWLSHSIFSLNRPASLLLVTITCAVFVADPLNFSKKITKNVIWCMIGMSWLVSVVYGILRTYGLGWLEVTAPARYCHQVDYVLHISGAVSIAVEFIIVSLALFIATIIVFIYSWRLRKNSPRGDPDLAEERSKQAKQAAILTATVNGLYVIMTLPLFIVTMQNYLQQVSTGSGSVRVAYIIGAAYDLVQLVIWMVLIPDVTYGVSTISACCAGDEGERSRLL